MLTTDDILSGEQLLPINTHAKRVLGKRIASATLWRWVHRGTKGGKLRAVHLGGRWLCTASDFADFLNRQTAAALANDEALEQESATDDDLRAAGLL